MSGPCRTRSCSMPPTTLPFSLLSLMHSLLLRRPCHRETQAMLEAQTMGKLKTALSLLSPAERAVLPTAHCLTAAVRRGLQTSLLLPPARHPAGFQHTTEPAIGKVPLLLILPTVSYTHLTLPTKA